MTEPSQQSAVVDTSWKIPYRFTVHVVVGATMFIVVAGVAVVLHQFVTWMAAQQIAPWIVELSRGVEYGLFVLDMILFVVYLLRAGFVHFRMIVQADSNL